MKKIIKWVSIVVAGLLVLAVAFTAVFVVIPFARTMRNLSEKKDEPTTVSSETVPAATTAPPATTAAQPVETTAPAEPAASQIPADGSTEYDIYRSGKFYIVGTVTDEKGQTNPMEMAVTDGSMYMLTAVSGVQMGVMIGGGKTYLVAPSNQIYIELSGAVMSMLGMDSSKLSASTNFNFSDMQPLSAADEITDAERNGAPCKLYRFGPADGKRSCVYMDGTRLLEVEMYKADGTLGNRMTFDSVSAEVPSDRIAPPTYFNKVGVLKFISVMSASLSK